MSTTNKTTGTNSTAFQFDPQALSAYGSNLSKWLPMAQSFFQNPFGNSMFQQENAAGQDQAANVAQRNKSNITANANALGYGTGGGLFNSMMQRAGRDTGTMQAQAFRGAAGSAIGRAMGGLQMASAFQPLMTGSNSNFTQTQTQSGVGTWLPQVIGAAGSAIAAGATGGASAAAGAAGAAGASSAASPFFNGTLGAFPGMNTGMTGMPNLFGGTPQMPSFYGQGYGYKGT